MESNKTKLLDQENQSQDTFNELYWAFINGEDIIQLEKGKREEFVRIHCLLL